MRAPLPVATLVVLHRQHLQLVGLVVVVPVQHSATFPPAVLPTTYRLRFGYISLRLRGQRCLGAAAPAAGALSGRTDRGGIELPLHEDNEVADVRTILEPRAPRVNHAAAAATARWPPRVTW